MSRTEYRIRQRRTEAWLSELSSMILCAANTETCHPIFRTLDRIAPMLGLPTLAQYQKDQAQRAAAREAKEKNK